MRTIDADLPLGLARITPILRMITPKRACP